MKLALLTAVFFVMTCPAQAGTWVGTKYYSTSPAGGHTETLKKFRKYHGYSDYGLKAYSNGRVTGYDRKGNYFKYYPGYGRTTFKRPWLR